VFRLHYDRPTRTHNYRTAVTVGARAVYSKYGYTGAGIGIAVIDAGVDGTHPDLCAAPQFCNGTPVKTVQNVKIIGDQQDGVDPPRRPPEGDRHAADRGGGR
jgi:serine protease AprX